jgi:phage major head subunit gpT-like protein
MANPSIPKPKTSGSEGPRDFRIVAAAGDLQWLETAAADGQAAKPRRFQMTAYTGGAMQLAGWRYPVVVDLAGLQASAKPKVFLEHDRAARVGHIDQVQQSERTLGVTGVVSASGKAAQEVLADAANGFPWQASIGARATEVEWVPEGASAKANGKVFQGPVNIARKTVLGEVSFVALGADDNTSAAIAATASQANKEQTMPQTTDSPMSASAAEPVVQPPEAIRAQAAAEMKRISAIQKICGGRGGRHDEIAAKAVEENWDATRTELEVLRADRPAAPAAHILDHTVTDDILLAAACQASRLPGHEKQFESRTLDAAHKAFRGRMGLQRLLMEGAWANGYGGRTFDDDRDGALRAAFSTFRLPGILQNIANKFLLAGFMSVESAWQQIAATRPVRDFKAITSYRMTGAFEYDEVGPDGELKHGQVDEESFTNQAKTYGKMFSVTRTDLINDDLGALTSLPQRIGRGGALKLNKVFWSAFLNNAAFFTTARANYKEGADTALSIDGLTAAELLFLEQKDAEGSPLGIVPRVLLVPPALLVRGTQLMQSTDVRDTTANTKYLTNNPHAGKFTVVYSAYLANATLVGYSAKAWYLLADPADLPVIEVAFLNGQQTPTVERADADFNVLGIQFRGYFDFGVALQDYRGGVKLKGEA